MAQNKVIRSPRKRYGVYIAAGVVMVAAIIATLITMGWFTIDDVNQWIALVVTLVVAIVGLGQSILSALNTDRDEPPRADPDVYDPHLGGTPRNQV